MNHSPLKRNVFTLIFVPIFFILCASDKLTTQTHSSAPSVNLPLGHYVYDLFERWETLGFLQPDIRLRNKPFDRRMVLNNILYVDSLVRNGSLTLNKADRQLFEKLKGEFHLEMEEHGRDYNTREKEKHLIHWDVEKEKYLSYAIADAILDQSVWMSRFPSREDSLNEAVSYTTASGVARGLLRGGIAYYADFSSTMIKGSDIRESNFMPTRQGIINKASNVYSLEANAYLVIEPKYFRLQFGKEKLVLGPGKRNTLFLSANAPAFDNLRLDVSFDRLKFTYFHGFLRSPEYAYWYDNRRSDRKYIAGHRVELKIFPWLFFAGNESVIYGGRPLETQYLNPVMIYHIAEQYAGDKDNNTMSFDFTAFPRKGWKWYGALFLDDYRLADNPFTYWKQQWAVMGGWYIAEPFGMPSSSLRLEYARIEPFVYSHKFTLINYSHFETSLGSGLPPNSDDISVEWLWQPARPYQIGFTYALTRHGEGDIKISGEEQGYGLPGKMKKKFLSGIRETRHEKTTAFFWEPIAHHRFYMYYTFLYARNYENKLHRNIHQHSLLIGYRLNY